MLQQDFTILNKLGLHARAASKLVRLTNSFTSKITIQKDGKNVDAKSIMNVMLLAAAKGTEVTLIIEGEDEAQALTALDELFQSGFGEGV